jgi:hypothetical protein
MVTSIEQSRLSALPPSYVLLSAAATMEFHWTRCHKIATPNALASCSAVWDCAAAHLKCAALAGEPAGRCGAAGKCGGAAAQVSEAVALVVLVDTTTTCEDRHEFWRLPESGFVETGLHQRTT